MKIPIFLVLTFFLVISVVSATPDWSSAGLKGASHSASAVQPAADPLKDLVITLERTPCYGTCPSYVLTIYRNGTYVFNGTRCVAVKGPRRGTVSRASVTSLVNAFRSVNFTSLNDTYETLMITDMPTVITSCSVNGTTKQVIHYHGDLNAPKGLSTLEDTIDTTINSKRFIGSGRNTRCLSE